MKQFNSIKKKLPLILLIGILMLCLGFILINCGKGPQGKIANPDAGQFAIDFKDCPPSAEGNACRAIIDSDVFKNDSSKKIIGKELTIEAWVKPHSTSSAGIFGRMDGGSGVALLLSNNTTGVASPRFAIRRCVNVSSPFVQPCDTTRPTSTAEYVVDSMLNISTVLDQWTHIAGVLVNEARTHPSSTSCTSEVMAQTPHIEIYVNGVFGNCATTFGGAGDGTPMSDAFTGEPGNFFMYAGSFTDVLTPVDGVGDNTQFDGIIDEPRLWGVARTKAEIKECINQELSMDSGTCGRITNNLIGYLRFNEGKGSGVIDWSGLGSGVKEYTNPHPPSDGSKPAISWFTGWTTDTPDLRTAD